MGDSPPRNRGMVPTIRPVVDWRCEDERAAGVPLWKGKDQITVAEQVKRDILAEAQAHMTALRDSVAELKAERAACEVRIAEIDMLLAEMGDVAKAKRGRKRKVREVAG